MAKKIMRTMIMVIAVVCIFGATPAFAVEADASTAAPAAVYVPTGEISAEWNVEKQTIEVFNIPYLNGDYKVQTIDSNGVKQNVAADMVTHLPINADGVYTVRVLRKQADSSLHDVVWKKTIEVVGCKQWLGSSEVVDMDESVNMLNSEVIKNIIALEEDYMVAQAAFHYLDDNWTYNYDRMNSARSWYTPNNDQNFIEKSGICYDYASAYAAIMRTAGIQTKVIFGYVQTKSGSVYHAWNEINLYGKWYIVDACWGEYGWTNYQRSISYEW